MTERPPSTRPRARLTLAVLVVLGALAVLLALAPLASAATPTFSGTFSGDKYPRFLPTDHTTASFQIKLNGSSPYHFTDGYYHLKLAFCPTSTYDAAAARGYTWNDAAVAWVQVQDDWSEFPQVQILNDMIQTGSNSNILWRFAQFGDDSVSTTFPTTPWYAFWLLCPVTGNDAEAQVCDTPVQLTLLNMKSDGGWVHNALPSGIGTAQYGSRAETGNNGSYTAPWGLEKVEPNQGLGNAPADDGAADIIPAPAYNGGFSLYAPYSSTSPYLFWVSEQKGNKTWPSPSAATLQVPFPDTNVAFDNTLGADMTPPSAPTHLTATPAGSTVALTWTAASDAAGVAGYRVYRWTDPTPFNGRTTYTPSHRLLPSPGSWVTTAGATAYADTAVAAGVTYHYEVRAIDAASNMGSRSNTATIDRTAPTTTDDAPLAWVTGRSRTVTFTATDQAGGSGVAATFSSVGGLPPRIGGSVTVAIPCKRHRDRIVTVRYWSVDAAGNVESPKSCQVKFDMLPPVTQLTAPLAPVVGPATVQISASDASSGVAGTWHRTDGGAWLAGTVFQVAGAGDHWVEFYSADVAGNVEPVRGQTVTIPAAKAAGRHARTVAPTGSRAARPR